MTGLPLTAYGLHGDTVKVERISDRQRTLVSGSQMQDTKVVVRTETVRDTVYIEKRDSSLQVLGRAKRQSRAKASCAPQVLRRASSESGLQEDGTPTVSGKLSAVSKILKWICWIIIGLIGLIVTAKVCSLRR